MPHAHRATAAAALLLLACGAGPAPTRQGQEPPATDGTVVGTWESSGDDPQLGGDVVVRLELNATGDLILTESSATSGRLRFAGSWSLEGALLVLRGPYFGAGGEARVTWELVGDSVLVLRDESGQSQRWRRR